MNLVTLRDPVLIPDPDPEPVEPFGRDDAVRIARELWGEYAADRWLAWASHLPAPVDADGHPMGWSIDEVRGLRFLAWRAQHGAFPREIDREAEA